MEKAKKPFVEVKNISKRFEGKTVLNNISFTIPYNSYFCICGPTGSGKSTLLRIIAGLESPDEGEIIINGKVMNEIPPEDRGIGMLFEHMTYALFPHYTIYENVIYGPRVRGMPSDETRKAALEMLRLVLLEDRADALPGVMSGGMKQRVALARALMTGSKLIILDEPLGALDAKIRLSLRKELVHMVQSLGDLTVIHVTQDIEEALMISDNLLVLFFGDILQMAPPEEIFDHPNSIEVCNFISKANFFEGIVQEVDETHSLIELKSKVIKVENISNPKGAQVVLAVRATDLLIKKEKSTEMNQLEGKILRKQFIHGTMRYEVKLPSKKILVAIQPFEPECILEEEEAVFISFEAKSPLVFPHPGEKLQKILAD